MPPSQGYRAQYVEVLMEKLKKPVASGNDFSDSSSAFRMVNNYPTLIVRFSLVGTFSLLPLRVSALNAEGESGNQVV